MREHTFKRWFLAACSVALIVPALASAAGLGRLTVLSALGQPLSAEIELLSPQKGETLTSRLSNVDTYQKANLPYNAALVGARVTVERRPNGTPYIKIVTSRPVNEPFAELLIEINSENGRVTRQYTVLLDPPGYGRSAGELPPPPVATPTVRPPTAATPEAAAVAPGAPVEGVPGPAAAAIAPAPAPSGRAARRAGRGGAAAPQAPSETASTKQYGPIKPGETLGRIAKSVQPEGVSLEQTLVGLYRQNPDAFIKKNMNLVKSGRILKVPEANEMTAVAQREAVKEVRLQVSDFNSFRGSLAERAGAAPEDGSVSSGRIGTRVAKGQGAAEPRDTVRLSRGDKGAKGSAAERVRALEEESVAREKALADANGRIAQLEKTIENMKRLAEMKGAAPADKAGAAPQPAAKGQAPGPVAVAPVIPPPAKAPEPAPPPKAMAPGKAPEAPAAKGTATLEAAPAKGLEPMKGATPEAPKGPADVAKAPAGEAKAPGPVAKGDQPPTKAKAKPPVPVTTTEPDFIDTLFDEPLYLVAGGGVIVLGLLGFVAARRRREAGNSAPKVVTMPTPPGDAGDAKAKRGAAAAAAASADVLRPAPAARPAAPPAKEPSAAPAPSAEDNDLDFNAATRSAAAAPRAEAPKRVEPAARPEPPKPAAPAAPPKVAEPAPAAYKPPEPAPRVVPPKQDEAARREPPKRPEPPKPAVRDDVTRAPEPAARAAAAPAVKPSTTGLGAARSLEGGPASQHPVDVPPVMRPEKVDSSPPDLPDFSLEVPPAGTAGADARPTPAAADFNMDFNLEPLPPIEMPGEEKPKAAAPAAPAAAAPQAQSNDLEFKLDDISLDFGAKAAAGAGAAKGQKDDHWYDVQQKFDLAKAYEEMGDKDGARDILREVVKEGDADQQAQAKKLLGPLA